MKHLILLALVVLTTAIYTSNSAQAGDPPFSDIKAYAFATSEAQTTGAAFIEADYLADIDDTILSASTTVADSVEIHVTDMNPLTAMMVMDKVDSYPIKAGEKLSFKPMGAHFMLMGLKAPLESGSLFPLIVNFEKAGAITFDIQVKKAGIAP